MEGDHKKSSRLNPCDDDSGQCFKLRVSETSQKIIKSHSVTSLCNQAFVSLELEDVLGDNYWAIFNDRIVLRLQPCSLVPSDVVVLDDHQRRSLGDIKSPEFVHLRRWNQPLSDIKCSHIRVSITRPTLSFSEPKRSFNFPENMAEMEQIIHTKFLGHVMTEGQNILLDTSGSDQNLSARFDMTITEIIGGKSREGNLARGVIGSHTVIRAFPGAFPQEFDKCNYASKIEFLVYDAKYRETECASDIELPQHLFEGRVLEDMIKQDLMNRVIHKGQEICYDHKSHKVVYKVVIHVEDIRNAENLIVTTGAVDKNTKISHTKFLRNSVFRPGVDPDNLSLELTKRGIDGMDEIFNNLANSLFKLKFLPIDLQNFLGIKPVKGVLFYGPAGTGKTLIAKNFCKLILCVTPKVVNGAEVLGVNYGTGGRNIRNLFLSALNYRTSERNIRNLFSSALKDFHKYGSSSPLHVIIFDQLDTIAWKIGENKTTHLGDRAVSQLRTQLDGVESLPNLLVLATTNRMELIDPGLLRPGRIEMHVFVGFPNQEERMKIFKMKSKPYMENCILHDDFDFTLLAEWTKDFSRADLEAVITRTFSRALEGISIHTCTTSDESPVLVKIGASDFRRTIAEISLIIRVGHGFQKSWAKA